MTLNGQPNTDPTTLTLVAESFLDGVCHSEIITLFQYANVTLMNDVAKNYNVTFYAAEARFSTVASTIYNCSQPITPGVLIDVLYNYCY